MKIAIVTDAWKPQVNGVVTTLVELVAELRRVGHEVLVVHPGLFPNRRCPGFPGLEIALFPGKGLTRQLDAFAPQAIHLATAGPLGWAARRYCLRGGLAFTTAHHTRFPEVIKSIVGLPLWMGYAVLRHFHRPSSGVMVPTQGLFTLLNRRRFKHLRAWTHGVDTTLFAYQSEAGNDSPLGLLARPVCLYVGRVSSERNIEAFLSLDLPGTKVVCGVGRMEASLQQRFPSVRWLGLLPREELAKVLGAADVFVFPGRSGSFGLAMLEAMSCGTPVAAYPVDGPFDVLRVPPGLQSAGGVMHPDLRLACYGAMGISRLQARSHACAYSWTQVARLFLNHLVPVDGGVGHHQDLALQGSGLKPRSASGG